MVQAQSFRVARRLSQLTDDNLGADGRLSPTLGLTECRKLQVFEKPLPQQCHAILKKMHAMEKVSEKYEGSHGGIAARAKAAAANGQQTHAQIQRRLTKSHNRK
ncbi:hypothetical protein TrVE_jg11824 [Triparma verrucosa]|uniref:Uncharacterized protein n=1 Tax=Triparma verrucosa TaxID=1606542 RepID=A0A9W7B9U7_9STRA|nr:hypothetical protein TrVE_jg11824 [Triparma verrucosa]